MSPTERQTWLDSLTDEQKAELRWHWAFWARQNQRAPEGVWNTWLVLAGRGFGKTRMGSEWIRENVCGTSPLAPPPSGARRIALVAETAEANTQEMLDFYKDDLSAAGFIPDAFRIDVNERGFGEVCLYEVVDSSDLTLDKLRALVGFW